MTKKEMILFLRNHFRYDTMNSWNRATSYAMNIKIHNVVPKELQDIAYEMLDVPEAFDEFNDILRDFDAKYENVWQIGTNGRSGGYLVLYQGGQKTSDYKSYCTECGQKNFKTVEETGDNVCGRCGEHARVNKTFTDVFTYPGKGLDMEDDFEEWDMDTLRERVALVKDFDKTCQKAVNAFIQFCKDNQVVEKTIMIPKKIKVAKAR